MKIVYAVTVIKAESFKHFESNVKLLRSMEIDLTIVLNTDHEVYPKIADKTISVIGGMKKSREALLSQISNYNADAYMVFDSDILLEQDFINDFVEIMEYKNNYDFISLYYKGDSPLPAFFTLASSLNDFYNQITNHKDYSVAIPFFDDTELSSSEYQKFNPNKSNKPLSDILYGRSYARDIPIFKTTTDERDTTTGGATIYFNKQCLNKTYDWENLNGKSLTWYDSYRTFMMSKEFRFSKVPFFVQHSRHKDSIKLSYESIERYALGLNKYMSAKDSSWNFEAIILHVVEMHMYIKGMIKKLQLINLLPEDKAVIQTIDKFINVDNNDFITKTRRLLWK